MQTILQQHKCFITQVLKGLSYLRDNHKIIHRGKWPEISHTTKPLLTLNRDRKGELSVHTNWISLLIELS